MQSENPVIQSIRINPSDKDTFAEISKQLGIPHHESFGKMVSLYKKMYTLEEEAPNRMAQAKEVTVLFERLVNIYEEVLSSNDTLKEHLVESHAKALSENEKKIHLLTDDIGQKNQIINDQEKMISVLNEEVLALKTSLKTAEDSLQKTVHLEIAKEELIENLRHEIISLNQRLNVQMENQKNHEKKLDKYNMSLDQLLFHYETMANEKVMYVEAVDQMKRDLKEKNDNQLNLKFMVKEKELEIKTLVEKVSSLESGMTQLRTLHESEKERIKEEYRQLYENQLSFVKEAYKLQNPNTEQNETK